MLFLVNLLIKPAWLLSDLWVQRTTGEDYGAYFVIFNLSMLFNIFLDVGINNYNNRKIGAIEGRVNNYFGRILSLKSFLSLGYIILLIPIGFLLKVDLQHMCLLAINQVLLSFILFFRSNLTGLKHFKLDSLISVLDRVFMIIGIFAYIFIYHEINIPAFIGIQTLGYVLVFIIAFFLSKNKIEITKIKFDWRFSKRLLLKSYPYAIIVLIMAGYSYSDSIMMKVLRSDGDYQNMIYAQSFRIIGAINNYAYLIAVILIPMFSKMLKQKENVQELLRIAGSTLILSLITFAIFANAQTSSIIRMLYGVSNGLSWWERGLTSSDLLNQNDIENSMQVFQWLIFAIVPMGFNYIYGALLTAAGKIKTLNFIALGGFSLNIVFNLLFIPKYGAQGAAWASVLTQYFAGVLQLCFCYKQMEITLKWSHFIRSLLIILLVGFVSYYITIEWKWYLSLMIVGLLMLTSLPLLKIVQIEDIKKVLKRKTAAS
jgi:O-antigen/teichoic acid export membrane protein